MNIGEGLLHDAEYRQFHVKSQLVKLSLGGQGNCNAAAPAEAFHITAQSPAQAEFFQQRRVKQVGDGAQLVSTIVHQPL
jgi:hypothetical protein